MQTRFTPGKSMFVFLVCAATAVITVYLTLKPGMDQEVVVVMPVEFTGLADNLIIASVSTTSIDVLIKGPPKRLAALNSPMVNLSLAASVSGDSHLLVTPDLLNLPPGISLLSVKPMSVRVTLDRKITRDLPVSIITHGVPAQGMQLVSATARPQTITVAGPKFLIESLTEIKTKPIDINGLSESCKKEAVFDTDPSQPMIFSQGTIIAQITLEPSRLIRKIHVPITFPNDRISANPSSATLELIGPANKFTSLDIHKDIQISIATEELEPGVYVRRAAINLPVDFTLISVKPELFTVTIR